MEEIKKDQKDFVQYLSEYLIDVDDLPVKKQVSRLVVINRKKEKIQNIEHGDILRQFDLKFDWIKAVTFVKPISTTNWKRKFDQSYNLVYSLSSNVAFEKILERFEKDISVISEKSVMEPLGTSFTDLQFQQSLEQLQLLLMENNFDIKQLYTFIVKSKDIKLYNLFLKQQDYLQGLIQLNESLYIKDQQIQVPQLKLSNSDKKDKKSKK